MDVTGKDSKYLRGVKDTLSWALTGSGTKLHRSVREISELMHKADDAEKAALTREYNERLEKEEIRPKWLVTTLDLRTNSVEFVAVSNIT